MAPIQSGSCMFTCLHALQLTPLFSARILYDKIKVAEMCIVYWHIIYICTLVIVVSVEYISYCVTEL